MTPAQAVTAIKGAMQVRRRSQAKLVATIGVVCLLFYLFIYLSVPSATAANTAQVLAYIGITALLVGAILYALARGDR